MNWTQSSWETKGGEGGAGQLVRVKLGARKAGRRRGHRGGIPPGAAFPRHVGLYRELL